VDAGFPIVRPNAAGIDVGSREHYAAVPEDRDPQSVRTFGCTTAELRALAVWLKDCRIDTVALEATGVYWIPLFEVLEDEGFEVFLVDGRQTRNVTGRKTDVQDCQWIQTLHSYGLLQAAFRPAREIAILRAYWRHRQGVVASCARQIHLMHKALEQMNVQLHKAVSDIAGLTGMKILRAIVAGERDLRVLARMRHRQVKATEEEIARALEGTYREEHLFALKQALETHDFFQKQLEECDEAMSAYMATLPPRDGESTQKSSTSRPRRRKNQPHFDLRGELVRIAGVDLTQIESIDAMTAQTIISEAGIDMTRFPSEKHFASWVTLCPNNRKTGGVIRSRRTRKSRNRLAIALRIAAQTLHRSKSALGAYYRRQRARLGPQKAITATAHKLARLVYRLLKYGETYFAQTQEHYETLTRQRSLRALYRRARSMGYELLDPQTGELVS
jgi:transposase